MKDPIHGISPTGHLLSTDEVHSQRMNYNQRIAIRGIIMQKKAVLFIMIQTTILIAVSSFTVSQALPEVTISKESKFQNYREKKNRNS